MRPSNVKEDVESGDSELTKPPIYQRNDPEIVYVDEAVAVPVPVPEGERTSALSHGNEAETHETSPAMQPPLYSTTNDRHGGKEDVDQGCDFLLCGDARVRGPRAVRPGTNSYISLFGDTEIDMRESEFPPNTKVKFLIVKLCGDVKIYVPRGTPVTVRRVALCGDKRIDVEEENEMDDSAPRLTVRIVMLCGSLVVKNRKDGRDKRPV